MKNAFAIIAERHQEMGSPGLVYCMQALSVRFDQLDKETQIAFEEFYDELMQFCSLRNG